MVGQAGHIDAQFSGGIPLLLWPCLFPDETDILNNLRLPLELAPWTRALSGLR